MTKLTEHDAAIEHNRAWWNERARAHRETAFYQQYIRRLQEGGLALLPLEVGELGDLSGQRVLHAQCHIGTDTLSLARLGADVTGVDFSEVAIEEARRLSRDLEIPAHFEVLEISELEARFAQQFQLVFASHGVLTWIPDLTPWARQLAACLEPGGKLFLSESHPLTWAIDDKAPIHDGALRLALPYLSQGQAQTFVEAGSYADPHMETRFNKTMEYCWGLGDVVNALIQAGLQIEALHEHPLGFYPTIASMTQGEDGHYRLPPPLHGKFPLTFTVHARKP